MTDQPSRAPIRFIIDASAAIAAGPLLRERVRDGQLTMDDAHEQIRRLVRVYRG